MKGVLLVNVEAFIDWHTLLVARLNSVNFVDDSKWVSFKGPMMAMDHSTIFVCVDIRTYI